MREPFFDVAAPGLAGPKDGVVIEARPCLQCGYSLLGLRVDGRCPECGAEVVRSLQGNLLVYSSAAFVRRLLNGATCVLGGVILFCLWIGSQLLPAVDLGRASSSRMVFAAMGVLACSLSLTGWWLLSSPDPALMGQDKAISARRVLRATLVVSMTALVAGVSSQWLLGGGPFISPVSPVSGISSRVFGWSLTVYLLNWPVKTIASLRYVRVLAMRIPNVILESRAKHLIQFALAGAVALALFIGLAFVLAMARAGLDSFACLAFVPFCGGFLAILIWWAVYASLIAGLRFELSLIARIQAVPPLPPPSPATSP